MANLTFLIEDSRYAVATLEFVTARDARQAEELAKERLNNSPYHLSVTVHLGETLLLRVAQEDRDDSDVGDGLQGQGDQAIGPM